MNSWDFGWDGPERHKDVGMRTDRDPELDKLRRRYVAAGRRYLRLNYGIFRLSDRERGQFAEELARAADAITPRELGLLLDCGWRERKTAAWLIAIAGRTDFRPRLGELFLASEGPYAGHAYCIALAAFGTPADTDLLTAYLDRYLARPDLDYDQPPPSAPCSTWTSPTAPTTLPASSPRPVRGSNGRASSPQERTGLYGVSGNDGQVLLLRRGKRQILHNEGPVRSSTWMPPARSSTDSVISSATFLARRLSSSTVRMTGISGAGSLNWWASASAFQLRPDLQPGAEGWSGCWTTGQQS